MASQILVNIGSGNCLVPDGTKPYYLIQCELVINDLLWYSPEGNFTGNDQKHYCKTSNISRILVGNKIVDNSDVVGASPVGAAPTTSSFST